MTIPVDTIEFGQSLLYWTYFEEPLDRMNSPPEPESLSPLARALIRNIFKNKFVWTYFSLSAFCENILNLTLEWFKFLTFNLTMIHYILDTIYHNDTLKCRPFQVRRLFFHFQTPKKCFSSENFLILIFNPGSGARYIFN